MKKARYPLGTPRYLLWVYLLILTIVFSACGSPTPITVVVTATSLPPTEGVVEPTATLVPVNLSGPQSGDKIRWIDGSNLIYVPPGEFVMGNGGFDAPVHNVTLDGYWMYQTKVTNRMFAQCVAVGSCTPPTEELGGPVYSNPEYANHPVVGVTWDQAQAYCGWANGQLPTEAQWEKAARGLAGNLYPWGNDEPACDLVNFGYCLGRTTEVDAFPDGASDFGMYDMAGNLFEWVSDWYSETYYSEAPAANPLGPDSGQYRVIRGS
ncbi:MAG TPA: formylglycine-generating enzyme family protein, partial [Anaerolineales bacterium]|nr:formylglycine-generating enzyme family protein [Anaerolineales bacterium]